MALRSFLVWKDEAFGLWESQWGALYPKGSPSAGVIEAVVGTYYLVTVVDNDYVAGDLFGLLVAATDVRRNPPPPPRLNVCSYLVYCCDVCRSYHVLLLQRSICITIFAHQVRGKLPAPPKKHVCPALPKEPGRRASCCGVSRLQACARIGAVVCPSCRMPACARRLVQRRVRTLLEPPLACPKALAMCTGAEADPYADPCDCAEDVGEERKVLAGWRMEELRIALHIA